MEREARRIKLPDIAADSATDMAGQPALAPEEQARADFYALISRLLLAAPDAPLLAALAAADSIAPAQAGSPLEQAWESLVLAAAIVDADAVKEEFDALFVAVATPAVNPYASLYLTGFMMEKPLAALRADLAALGLARHARSGEPEDHLGALCEAMRILIAGAPGVMPQPVAAQRAFFDKHIAPWHARCLDDIRRAQGANFYQRVADFIEAFFAVEAQAFDIEDAWDAACELR